MTSHTFAPLQACLFDMDGTLVDSTGVVEIIWTRWAEKHGLAPAEVLQICHGRQASATMQQIAPHLDLAHEAREMLRAEMDAVDGVKAIAGVHAFLRQLPAKRWAIVTSAARSLALRRLQICGIEPPSCLIAAEDTARSKPDPEGFLAGARALGADPKHCLVLEDSLAGLTAGRQAGAHTLQICQAKPPRSEASPLRVLDYRALKVTQQGASFTVVASPLCP